MAVALTRLELDAGDLRREAKHCRDAKVARRMLALALVLEGSSREMAARHAGMDRQTLRDGVHRYNVEGLAGLLQRRGLGRAATTSRAWPGCATGPIRGRRRGSRRSSWSSWRGSSRTGRTRNRTGWCAGGGSTCRR